MAETTNLAEFISADDLAPTPVFAFNPEGAMSSRIWSAAYRQHNLFSAVAETINDSWQGSYEEDSDYDPFRDPQLKAHKGIMHKFLTSGSRDETYRRLQKYHEDMEDLALLGMTPSSTMAEFVNMVADPAILAPLAPAKVLTTPSKFKRFMYGGAFSAAIVAPSEIIKQSQLEGHTLGHTAVALAGATLIGGTLTAALGRPMAPIMTHTDKQIYRSAGANVSPEKSREAAFATMEGDALAETGIGIEKMPWNPVTRLTQSPLPFSRMLPDRMVDMGGMQKKKVKAGEEMDQSVEATFRTTYLGRLVDALRASDEAYLSYRGKVAKDGDISRSFQMMGAAMTKPKGMLSEAEFRIRVGKGLKNGDVDEITDIATPHVNSAIKAYRKQFDFIKEQAESVDLFRRQLNAKLLAAREAGNEQQVTIIEAAIAKFNAEGVTVNTAASYLPRVARIDKIMENEQLFLDRVSGWAKGKYEMTSSQANAFARGVMDELTRTKPFLDLDEVADQFEYITAPSGVKARTFEIPDKLIEEFVENDAEVLLRHHTRTMGMDIELSRAFGDIDMRTTIQEITSEYQRLIDDAADVETRRNLKKALEDDLRDIRGLRDRLRGTYGASKDPHAMSSRFVRVMKSFNVLVGMGGAVVSSVPDVARIVMVEGMTNAYSKGLKHMFASNDKVISKMLRKEMRAAAVSVDAVLGLRAAQFSDVGDLFGARFGFERTLNHSVGGFFMLNGLNYWNQVLKEWAGNTTALLMTDRIMKNWGSLSKADQEKFLKNGINQQDHMRMQALIKANGQKVDGEWMPNTDLWGDPIMVRKFRNALNQNVERIIVTPGAGDRALWTSTEFGSLLTQFKSYGQGAMVRVLTAGLQEKDAAFWQGAFLMVGLASLVNEFKRYQYGIDKEQDFDEKLIDAIDRSGTLGWFTDVNNAIEKISDFNLGVRPLLTDEKINYMPDQAKAASVFGPTVNLFGNLGSVAGDFLSGNVDAQTGANMRFITPLSNIPYIDPAFDIIQQGIFGKQ